MSPNRFKRASDGELILTLLRATEKQPITRPVDPKKLARKPFYKAESKRGKKTITTVVSVPGADEPSRTDSADLAERETAAVSTRHTEIQHALLMLGAIWASSFGLRATIARKSGAELIWDRCPAWSISCRRSLMKRRTERSN